LKLVMGSQSSRINGRLVATADDLRLFDLVEAMERVRQESTRAGLTHDHEQGLEVGRDSLRRLDGRLQGLVDAHKRWQWLDDRLRMLEEGSSRGLFELELLWRDVSADLERLCQEPGNALEQPLLEELGEAGTQLGQLLARHDPSHEADRVWMAFARLRGAQVQRVYNVDLELKSLCGELRKLEKPLSDLLGRLE
jgi:hypothetical protein